MNQISDLEARAPAVAPPLSSESLVAAIGAVQMAMVVTDPKRDDNPIVFANDAFLTLTGYARGEVLGRNCRFLQGPDTSKLAVKRIRDALRRRRAVSLDLLNYRKDGTPFWNDLYLSPVFDAAGRLDYFFGAQLNATRRVLRQNEDKRLEAAQVRRNADLEAALETQRLLFREVDHRVKNSLQMVGAMLTLQALGIPDPAVQATLREMLDRVEALGLAHRRFYEKAQTDRFDLADFLRELATDVVGAAGRRDIRLVLALEPVTVGADQAAALALVLNEALTNAVKHGFAGGRPGTLRVSLTAAGGRVSVGVADDGPGLPADAPQRFGTTLIRTLVDQLGATLDWHATDPGTLFRLTLPPDPAARG